MSLEVQAPLEVAFQAADNAGERLDEFVVRDRLVRVMADLGEPTPAQRKGNFALIEAFNFQHARDNGPPVWQMHWQPLCSGTDKTGNLQAFPDVTQVDDEVIQEWSTRAAAARHPLLKARYADLAWEVAKYRRSDLIRKADVSMARLAVDGYLNAVERGLMAEDLYAWVYIERALELAALISNTERVQRAKAILFRFHAECEARGPYMFWRFHEIAWSQKQVLALTGGERLAITQALERQLALRSDIGSPEVFQPHLARTAADCLDRWYESSGQQGEARRAALTAGAAFEAAAGKAGGLTAIAWLSEQAQRYRQLGDEGAVARVEETIRDRAAEAQGGMKRISVPVEIPRDELDAWADRVAGETLDAGLQGFAAAGLLRRDSTERAVLDMAAQSPLNARISISITGRDGFPKAKIGSVDEDLDGRTVYHATQLLTQSAAPWLNVAWGRLSEKHAVDIEQLLVWLSQCPFFPPSRLSFIREGLAAWFAGDMVKAIHVLVPQVESALRDVLGAIGGAVTWQRPDGGFQEISLGEVLSHERFKAVVPEDMRFHFKVLYQDPRGLNLRNEVAHGIAAFELFGLGVSNLVVHSIILIGLLRPKPNGPESSDSRAGA